MAKDRPKGPPAIMSRPPAFDVWRELANSDRLTVFALWSFASEPGGEVWPSLAALCSVSGLSRRSVITSLGKLEALGIVSDTGARKGKGVRVFRLGCNPRTRATTTPVQPLHPEVQPLPVRGAAAAPDPVQPLHPEETRGRDKDQTKEETIGETRKPSKHERRKTAARKALAWFFRTRAEVGKAIGGKPRELAATPDDIRRLATLFASLETREGLEVEAAARRWCEIVSEYTFRQSLADPSKFRFANVSNVTTWKNIDMRRGWSEEQADGQNADANLAAEIGKLEARQEGADAEAAEDAAFVARAKAEAKAKADAKKRNREAVQGMAPPEWLRSDAEDPAEPVEIGEDSKARAALGNY